MSLLATASPYNQNSNCGSSVKRRKATLPPPSSKDSTLEEVKKYMTQLIQNKEQTLGSKMEKEYSAYGDNYSFVDSVAFTGNDFDQLYPILEPNSDTNGNHRIGAETSTAPVKEVPNYSDLPETFYKPNKQQQNGILSALQKLTGGESLEITGTTKGATEGMTTLSESVIPITPQQQQFAHIKAPTPVQNADYFIPTTPLNPNFNMKVPIKAVDNISGLSTKSSFLFSDYANIYSPDNYVVPPHFSQYSYPVMGGQSATQALMQTVGGGAVEKSDQQTQILLEKINYMIYLLEQQKKEKSKHTTEEFVLYSFVGVFVIYLADSFARSGRYIR